MGSADAGTLHAVTICSRAAATAADSKDLASFFTDHMLAPHAQAEALNDYRQSSVLWFFDESGQPPLYCSASVLRIHYSVKARTLTCALGRSGIARRDLHGQLQGSTYMV